MKGKSTFQGKDHSNSSEFLKNHISKNNEGNSKFILDVINTFQIV